MSEVNLTYSMPLPMSVSDVEANYVNNEFIIQLLEENLYGKY